MRSGLRSMSSPFSVRVAFPRGVYCSLKMTCSVLAWLYRFSTPCSRSLRPESAPNADTTSNPKISREGLTKALTQQEPKTCKAGPAILSPGQNSRQPYCTEIVAPCWLGLPPTVTTIDTAPERAAAGTTKLTCSRPDTRLGASP